VLTLHEHERDRDLHVVGDVERQDHQDLFVRPRTTLEGAVDEQLGRPRGHQAHELALEHQYVFDDLLGAPLGDLAPPEGSLAQSVK